MLKRLYYGDTFPKFHVLFYFQVAVGSVEIRNYNIKNLDAEEKPWKDADFEITFLQRVPSVVGRYSEQRSPCSSEACSHFINADY